ncbi:MAG: hypothetical protein ABI837_19260 [Acidobacteriota bacterium]
MNTAGPDFAQERAMEMRHHFSKVPAIRALDAGWHSSSPILAAVFFVLTCSAISAFFGLLALLSLPKGVMTAVPCIGLAEYLIRKKKMFGSGIESGLWIGGLFAFIFGLPSEGKIEALLVFAVAAAIAGVRMRNALFGALAAILVVVYVAVKADHLHHGQDTFWSGGAAALAIVLALIAALALTRTWRRPSTEALFSALVITMTTTAYLVGKIASGSAHIDPIVAAVFCAMAIAYFATGVVARHHVLILCGAIATACVAFELQDLLAWPWEWKVIVAGTEMFVAGAGISRLLRGRSEGIVVTETDSGLLSLVQAGATFVVAHPAAPEPSQSGFESGGGSFGGGGASGGYEG